MLWAGRWEWGGAELTAIHLVAIHLAFLPAELLATDFGNFSFTRDCLHVQNTAICLALWTHHLGQGILSIPQFPSSDFAPTHWGRLNPQLGCRPSDSPEPPQHQKETGNRPITFGGQSDTQPTATHWGDNLTTHDVMPSPQQAPVRAPPPDTPGTRAPQDAAGGRRQASWCQEV